MVSEPGFPLCFFFLLSKSFLCFFLMASENTATTDESQNPSSSFYLHPGENPGATLVNIQLDGSNYHAWSRAMKRALISKNKHKFLDGSVKTPTHGTILHDAWERCNMMVILWLTRAMNTQIAQSVVYIENAKDL